MIRKISFREEDHTYRDEESRYLNWSSFIKEFEQPFDREFWLLYKATERLLWGTNKNFPDGVDPQLWLTIKGTALKHHEKMKPYVDKSKYKALIYKIADEIEIEWETSKQKGLDKGKKYHQEKEEEHYRENNMIIGQRSTQLVSQYNYDLWSLPDGGYSELLVYYAPLKLCGTLDKGIITTVGGERYIDIDDYKTNKELIEHKYDKYKAPINHLWQNDVNKYKLQITFYAYILSLWGYKIRSTRFTHHTDAIDIPYKFDPLVKEMKMMFDYRKKMI